MNLQKLELVHFRNYERSSYQFEPACVHCLYGNNAQGKTNIIEAIYFLSHLRSFRTSHIDSLTMHQKEWMSISAWIESHGHNEQLKIVVSQKKKHLFVYQDPVRRYSDFIGKVNAILFCPDDMLLFQQSPRSRRRFIDMELMKLSHTYTATLSHFQSLLKQRNRLLKQDVLDDLLLNTLTEQMIQDEEIIISQRAKFVKEWMDQSRSLYPFFSEQKERIDAHYQTFVKWDHLQENLKMAYEKSLERDKQYRQTTFGIHKDDIVFLLNEKPLHEVGSQGQKRSFLLAMKLGLAQIIYEKTQQYPILLLDDVFSELDPIRQKQLIQPLPQSMQVFITSTEPIDKHWFGNRSVRFYHIEDGALREVQP